MLLFDVIQSSSFNDFFSFFHEYSLFSLINFYEKLPEFLSIYLKSIENQSIAIQQLGKMRRMYFNIAKSMYVCVGWCGVCALFAFTVFVAVELWNVLFAKKYF